MTREQVEYAGHLVGRMILRSDAIAMIAERFNVSDDEAKRIYRMGRKEIRRWLSRPAEDHHLESAAYYRAMVQRNDVEPKEQLKARTRLDRVLGVDGPVGERDDVELNAEQVVAAVERIVERYKPQADEPVVIDEQA